MVLQRFFAIVTVGHVIRTVTLCALPYYIADECHVIKTRRGSKFPIAVSK